MELPGPNRSGYQDAQGSPRDDPSLPMVSWVSMDSPDEKPVPFPSVSVLSMDNDDDYHRHHHDDDHDDHDDDDYHYPLVLTPRPLFSDGRSSVRVEERTTAQAQGKLNRNHEQQRPYKGAPRGDHRIGAMNGILEELQISNRLLCSGNQILHVSNQQFHHRLIILEAKISCLYATMRRVFAEPGSVMAP